MKTLLKENWFKIAIVLIALGYLFFFIFGEINHYHSGRINLSTGFNSFNGSFDVDISGVDGTTLYLE